MFDKPSALVAAFRWPRRRGLEIRRPLASLSEQVAHQIVATFFDQYAGDFIRVYGARMVTVVLSASSSAPAPDLSGWLAIVAALGVGSLVGSLAVTIVGYINGERQRAHEQRLREEDRLHDREMAEAESRRRLDERRREELREGLVSVVDAVLEVERWLNVAKWEDVPSQEKAALILDRAIGGFVKARAGLLLDKEGERIVRATADLSRDVDRYRYQLTERQELRRAAQPGTDPQLVLDVTEEINNLHQEILRKVQQVITDARKVLDRQFGPSETGNAQRPGPATEEAR